MSFDPTETTETTETPTTTERSMVERDPTMDRSMVEPEAPSTTDEAEEPVTPTTIGGGERPPTIEELRAFFLDAGKSGRPVYIESTFANGDRRSATGTICGVGPLHYDLRRRGEERTLRLELVSFARRVERRR